MLVARRGAAWNRRALWLSDLLSMLLKPYHALHLSCLALVAGIQLFLSFMTRTGSQSRPQTGSCRKRPGHHKSFLAGVNGEIETFQSARAKKEQVGRLGEHHF